MHLKAEGTVTIDRQPGVVFAVVADASHWPDWSKGAGKVLNVSENPATLGTTWTQITRLLGKDLEIHAKVNVYQANGKFGYQIDKPVPADELYLLEPSGSGTKLTFSIEGDPGGFFGVAAPLLKKVLKDQISADLGSLKAQLEAQGQSSQ